LVKAGSGLATLGITTSAGVPEAFAQETIVLPLNDEGAVKTCLQKYKDEIACIIIEPIPANNGLLIQDPQFLHFLREICTEQNVLLFFDEVISGFRVGFEGAAGLYDIHPDIITFGKIIGGGLPVGAYAASKEIMSQISPDGPVYQAGTLSGNPVAMMAGYAALKEVLKEGFFEGQKARTEYFVNAVVDYAKSKDYNFSIYTVGSIFWLAFSENIQIRKASEIDADSMQYFKRLHSALLERGVYLGPSGFEVGFISEAHTKEYLDIAIQAFKESLDIAFE
jgi:glutamate-1-semialdehyde 2,1-aminomutase